MASVKVETGFLPRQSIDPEADLQSEGISKQHSKEDVTMNRENESVRCTNVEKDVLLQWGQRKRQRNGRLETKVLVGGDSFVHPKKPMKTDARFAGERIHNGSPQTQPPVLNRALALRPCTPFKEITASNGTRNVDAFTSTDPGIKNGRRQDLQRNPTSTAEKLEPREPLLRDEHRRAACNMSINGGALAAHTLEQPDREAFQERPQGFEKVDLESFEWPKFLLALSRKEKEEDFLAIKGTKLPQRPKKRSKHIEKVLHFVSPGMWLCDLSRERYEVREKKTVKKRPRGLKAMSSVDTDSE